MALVATVRHMANDSRTLGANIRELRRLRGLKRVDVAVAVGVDPHTVGRWERDEANPHPHHLVALATVLEVEAAALGYEAPVAIGSEAPPWAVQQFEQTTTALERIWTRVQDTPDILTRLDMLADDLHAIRAHLGIERTPST